MSTTFGVKIPQSENIIEVAYRSNTIMFTNLLAYCLSDDTEVIAMDNTPQGIFTIGDIKKKIKEQDPNGNNRNFR
jgi:hypothetical protein